jgi:hypothetical protein
MNIVIYLISFSKKGLKLKNAIIIYFNIKNENYSVSSVILVLII